MGGALAEFAGDGGVAVLVDGAHPLLGGGDFEGRVDVGEKREDFGAREGQRGGADIEEAVAEGVDAIAVDVGDGAVGADADRSPAISWTLIMEPGLRSAGLPMAGSILAAAGDALAGFEAEGAELRREGIEGGAAEAAEGERRGDIDHAGLAGARRVRGGECGG